MFSRAFLRLRTSVSAYEEAVSFPVGGTFLWVRGMRLAPAGEKSDLCVEYGDGLRAEATE